MWMVKRDRDSLTRNPWSEDAFPGWPFWNRFEEDSVVWAPRVDIRENEHAFIVEADLPGVDKKDIKVQVENNILTIRGERKQVTEEKEGNNYRSERLFGMFQRTFTLSERIKTDAIKADYNNGVLTLTLPKMEELKPKQIEIN